MTEHSSIWLSGIPRCATTKDGRNVYDLVRWWDKLANGGYTDGVLTSDEFEVAKKHDKTLKRFKEFSGHLEPPDISFEDYVHESVARSKCDEACLQEMGTYELKDCFVLPKPDLPPIPAIPKRVPSGTSFFDDALAVWYGKQPASAAPDRAEKAAPNTRIDTPEDVLKGQAQDLASFVPDSKDYEPDKSWMLTQPDAASLGDEDPAAQLFRGYNSSGAAVAGGLDLYDFEASYKDGIFTLKFRGCLVKATFQYGALVVVDPACVAAWSDFELKLYNKDARTMDSDYADEDGYGVMKVEALPGDVLEAWGVDRDTHDTSIDKRFFRINMDDEIELMRSVPMYPTVPQPLSLSNSGRF